MNKVSYSYSNIIYHLSSENIALNPYISKYRQVRVPTMNHVTKFEKYFVSHAEQMVS